MSDIVRAERGGLADRRKVIEFERKSAAIRATTSCLSQRATSADTGTAATLLHHRELAWRTKQATNHPDNDTG